MADQRSRKGKGQGRVTALVDTFAALQHTAVWLIRDALAAVLLVIGLSVAGAIWWPGSGRD